MIETASHVSRPGEVYYTGIDLFESRVAQENGLTLKAAHQKLAPTGAHIRLVPGDAFSAIARIANSLQGLDLVVISGDQPAEALNRAWFYFPRMLHGQSQVFLQKPCQPGQSAPYDRVSTVDIAAWASPAQRRRAA